MSNAREHEPTATTDAIVGWAESVGVRFEPDRVPAVATYLSEIRVAIEALDHLDLRDAGLSASFDPSWDGTER